MGLKIVYLRLCWKISYDPQKHILDNPQCHVLLFSVIMGTKWEKLG